jgi:hypothetical protein
MMGPRQIDQAALFCGFSLERHVPATRSAGQHHLDARENVNLGSISFALEDQYQRRYQQPA